VRTDAHMNARLRWFGDQGISRNPLSQKEFPVPIQVAGRLGTAVAMNLPNPARPEPQRNQSPQETTMQSLTTIHPQPRNLGPIELMLREADARCQNEVELSPLAYAMVSSLPAELPCTELRTRYPRLLDRIAMRRTDARGLNDLFESLLLGGPDHHPGMGFEVLLELTDLRVHLMRELARSRAAARSIWADA
jgi:hypothetical protein